MNRSDPAYKAFPDIQEVEVLVLDLGGVIIDIDPERSSKAFARLGKGGLLKEHSKAEQDELFDRFERGEIDAKGFREELRERAGIEANDRTIDEAWNALLLGIPDERFRTLERMAGHYRLHLFSNTNEIHMEGFKRIVEKRYGMEAFFGLFEAVHLSYRMGRRKPEKEAFDHLLDRIGSLPEKTIFIDDTEAHVKAARERGIVGLHLDREELSEWELELLP